MDDRRTDKASELKFRPAELHELRTMFRSALRNESHRSSIQFFKAEGISILVRIQEQASKIRGSYFGMLQGKYPMHLLYEKPLPPRLFEGIDSLPCEIWRKNHQWAFVPSGISDDDGRYFRLEFDLPEEIAGLVQMKEGDLPQIANLKRQYFSYIDVVGLIGGVHRQVRLELDQAWLDLYIEAVSHRKETKGA